MASVRSHITVLIFALLSVIISAGCSSPVQPDNLEPTIGPFEATDITRTEALITARIQLNGSAPLTHASFHYGEDGVFSQSVQVGDPGAQILTCHLSGLRPGATYSWYVEAGTATATLRSATMTFTTIPNDRPSVSPLVALSTGPVGIIVSFDITDDGGEPVIEAGCEVRNNHTLETSRICLPSDALSEGSHRVNIGGLSLETSYTFTPFASNTAGESQGEPLDYTTQNSIILDEAGSLPKLFEGSKSVTLQSLTVTGDMNGDDFRFLRLLLGAPLLPGELSVRSEVTEVDLTDANIVEGGESYDGSRYTVADEVTTGLFADCVQLRRILLPVTATVMARDAFARCTALEELTIPAAVGSVLPSDGCPALKVIDVSPANEAYTSVDGVLFNREATEILWFPLGKTGTFVLPSTLTSIGESAFAGTSITGLEIPSSVTAISRGAFAESSLAEITLPDNLTNIQESMFQYCASLTTLHLGKGTEYVGNYFIDGTALTDLYVAADIPPYAPSDAFVNGLLSVFEHCTLHVPAGRKAAYRNHARWGCFNRIVEF
ncbi:MAG: leucine-rich repeat domain-containing protein [Duncaniella sp.]|nr:leucine-rich repeat domain-containing protein [Duncaniella sp.]